MHKWEWNIHWSFWNWLNSLNRIICSCVHFLTNDLTSLWMKNSIAFIYQLFFTQSSAERHLSWFLTLAIVHEAAVNAMSKWELYFSLSLPTPPEAPGEQAFALDIRTWSQCVPLRLPSTVRTTWHVVGSGWANSFCGIKLVWVDFDLPFLPSVDLLGTAIPDGKLDNYPCPPPWNSSSLSLNACSWIHKMRQCLHQGRIRERWIRG